MQLAVIWFNEELYILDMSLLIADCVNVFLLII